MASEEAIAEKVLLLFSAWGRKAETGSYLAFEAAFADLSDTQLEQAVLLAIHRGGEHPPSAGDLRKLSLGQHPDQLEVEATGAWFECRELARKSRADKLRFSRHPSAVVRYAVDACGGWPKFVYRARDGDQWLRKEFVDAFSRAAGSKQLQRLADNCLPRQLPPQLRLEGEPGET